MSDSLFNYQAQCKELTTRTAGVTAQQQRELLKYVRILDIFFEIVEVMIAKRKLPTSIC